VRAVVSKRGVDDGNQKGGGFLQPAQESHNHYNTKKTNVKSSFKFFLQLKFPRRSGKIKTISCGGRKNGRKKD
jgi:hypothetical protein